MTLNLSLLYLCMYWFWFVKYCQISSTKDKSPKLLVCCIFVERHQSNWTVKMGLLTLFSHLNHSILFLYSCFLGHDDDNVVNFVKSAIANIMGLYSQFALRDYTVSQCLGSTLSKKNLFGIYINSFSNFSCRFLSPNYFFQFEL